ncbi:nucleoside 2-deoxyribosyltransferase-like protein [Brevundimonas phage vB_BpoS-Gurke]|uniref:Nucleoside 2-deoxyribosyltransferase-like protein n=1 Tax=Brevundimonas phage vB_BpoS-Gurke TaxID=2948599 RepID=A0A9E7N3D6_9CAUD|nr:nucleoside 2-deoxyribosyltransferase-like protein [Brevundimonas phage vB_BpoS-Gurke]
MRRKTLHVTPPKRVERPEDDRRPSIFLAGTIDMGLSQDWQAIARRSLEGAASVIYNPRRPDWDSSWEQRLDNMEFREQVNWEMDMIQASDLVFIHFEGDSKSPITLGELYWMLATRPEQVVVSCAPQFWRRGNVEVMCDRIGVPLHTDLYDALDHLHSRL